GYVFVTRGLVERMRNEAELAGVLAHEIGHVLQKHHLKAIANNARFALVTDSLSAANKSLNGEAKSLVANAARSIFAKGLDKEDEYEADRLGVVIAARAGYDPYGLPAVLQMLEAQNPNDGGFSLLFRTHPQPAARLELLDRTMRDRFDAVAGASGKPVKERVAEFAK
ncbi:peptidase, partial [Oxalobacteraceae bacterium OM1]